MLAAKHWFKQSNSERKQRQKCSYFFKCQFFVPIATFLTTVQDNIWKEKGIFWEIFSYVHGPGSNGPLPGCPGLGLCEPRVAPRSVGRQQGLSSA